MSGLPSPKAFAAASRKLDAADRRPRRAKKREATVEAAARQHAQEMGWDSRKMNGLGYMSWPDRKFFPPRRQARGRSFFVEFKRPGEQPTDAQWLKIKELRERGEAVHVIDNMDDFRKALKHEGQRLRN